MVPSIIDVWGYDREFCSSSSSPSTSIAKKPKEMKGTEVQTLGELRMRDTANWSSISLPHPPCCQRKPMDKILGCGYSILVRWIQNIHGYSEITLSQSSVIDNALCMTVHTYTVPWDTLLYKHLLECHTDFDSSITPDYITDCILSFMYIMSHITLGLSLVKVLQF